MNHEMTAYGLYALWMDGQPLPVLHALLDMQLLDAVTVAVYLFDFLPAAERANFKSRFGHAAATGHWDKVTVRFTGG